MNTLRLQLSAFALLWLGLTLGTAQKQKTAQAPAAKASAQGALNPGIYAQIDTDKGQMLLRLFYEKTPITAANFVALAEGNHPQVEAAYKGKPFYNGLKFHRVIADFMIQGGDPQGNGSGGPGYAFKDEITDLKHYKPGILSMANAGPKTNGSQFFITHKATPWLDGRHTVFGEIVKGMEVVNAIKQDDGIKKVTIIRQGAAAKAFDAPKIFSAYYAQKADEDAREAKLAEEARQKRAAEEAAKQQQYRSQYGEVLKAQADALTAQRAKATKTASGLEMLMLQKGNGKKPENGKKMYVHYAGYLEDGSLFDTSYEAVAKKFGKLDADRAKQNMYKPLEVEAGKLNFIPGFAEGLQAMQFGDKALLFIPSKLGYGERGAGNVIPPNANIIFEVELLEKMP